jgi:hypothetical protein
VHAGAGDASGVRDDTFDLRVVGRDGSAPDGAAEHRHREPHVVRRRVVVQERVAQSLAADRRHERGRRVEADVAVRRQPAGGPGAGEEVVRPQAAAQPERQADALRRRAANEIDWDNVSEEIEDVARRDKDRLYGALVTAILHLLKWRFQPEARSNAWRAAVVAERNRIAKLVRDSPTLRPYPATVLAEAYSDARTQAEAETGLAGFPATCPWAIEQVLDHAFWPDDAP